MLIHPLNFTGVLYHGLTGSLETQRYINDFLQNCSKLVIYPWTKSASPKCVSSPTNPARLPCFQRLVELTDQKKGWCVSTDKIPKTYFQRTRSTQTMRWKKYYKTGFVSSITLPSFFNKTWHLCALVLALKGKI